MSNKPAPIIWEKYIDPFDDNPDDIEIPEGFGEDDVNFDDGYEQNNLPFKVMGYEHPNITNQVYISKQFNFWIGHTKLKISSILSDRFDNVPGVESLEIYSPYRFRISVAKQYDSAEVMSEMSNIVHAFSETN